MIDLADPNTDIGGLFKEYVNYENKNYRAKDLEFDFFYIWFETHHKEFDTSNRWEVKRELLMIWCKVGLIEDVNGNR